MPSRASSSVDLMVEVSCGLTLQICLIIALSFRCRRWRLGFVNGQVSLAWSIALRTHELYTRPRVLKERWQEERAGFSSKFQAVFTCVVVESSQPPAAESMSLGSKRKLPPPACQARLGLLSGCPVPQIMIFVFPAFTLSPFSSIASFQVKSLLTHSSSYSAMITRSSA